MNKPILSCCLAAALTLGGYSASDACTNILVTRGASADNATHISYSADSHLLYGALYHHSGSTYPAGSTVKIYEWDSGKYLGEIPQVTQTYSTVGNMNEYQLAIGETTFGGRSELADSTGLIDYGSLIYLTLQRAKSAREAISVMTSLVDEFGYYSGGESFSIADKEEVWILEMIGKGTKMAGGKNVNKGAVWVALRIPDGYICSHANQARITTFPLDDPENCLYAKDVISFAREAGYFKGKDKDFSFADAYAPIDFGGMRYCEARVWSVFNRFTPGMEAYVEYAMGHDATKRMPLWVKPSHKLSVKDIADAMRDHYEGTPMDMTQDIGAGGEACPYRWRPMTFEVDGKTHLNERAVATQQTGFWFVSQSRSYLPDEIGGVLWFGVDDAATSCLTPVYTCSTKVSPHFAEGNGDMLTYSSTSAFWIFNRVAQFAYLRYNVIGKAVQEAADEFERQCLETLPAIDKAALTLYESSPAQAQQFLTDYSVSKAGELFDRWVALDQYLMVKYMDGNVKKEQDGRFLYNGNGGKIPAAPENPGYSEQWKRAVAEDTGDRLLVVEPKR